MRISAISQTPYFKSNYKSNSKSNKNILLPTVVGIGLAGVAVVGAGIACKSSFNKSIAKKGLELKDNVLINKETGKKFTGKIKSNVGLIGFNRRETRVFKDGVIQEITYRNLLGREKEGYFYKDGKGCLNVNILSSLFIPWKEVSAKWFCRKR